MSKFSKSIAAGMAIAFAVGGASIAQAYPAGTKPTIGLSSYSRLTPGDDVTAIVAHVAQGCHVTFTFGDNTASAVAGRTGRTAATAVTSPSVGGTYNLSTTFGAGCAGDTGLTTVKKSILVGHLLRHSVAIKTSSSSARRNPTLTISGKLFWGATAQAGKSVTVVIHKPGADVTAVVTTDSKGVYTTTLSNAVAGAYSVSSSVEADSSNAPSSATSRTVTIRP